MTAVPRRRAPLAFAAAFALPAVAVVVGVLVGPARLSVGDVFSALLGGATSDLARDVVWVDRVPRVGLGLVVGAGLALAGTVFQALLRNPLADPYLVGVGPGALLGAAVGTALGVAGHALGGLLGLGGCAFAGAAVAAAAVLYVAGRGAGAAPRLVLAGVAVGAFATAVATWLLYVRSEDWARAVRWLLGTIAWADGPRLLVAGAGTALLVGLVAATARDLDALSLGEDSARLGGVDPARAVPRIAAVACLATGLLVAAAGLVGFVGLVVPHLARRLVGPSHRTLLPVAAALGAGLLVLADAAARATTRLEVPVGVVTALCGAPVLAAFLRGSRGGRAS